MGKAEKKSTHQRASRQAFSRPSIFRRTTLGSSITMIACANERPSADMEDQTARGRPVNVDVGVDVLEKEEEEGEEEVMLAVRR